MKFEYINFYKETEEFVLIPTLVVDTERRGLTLALGPWAFTVMLK